MSSSRKHKRRRLNVEAEPTSLRHFDGSYSSVNDQDDAAEYLAETAVVQEAPTEEFDVDVFAKDREIWDAFREEQYEVLEQLPLSLHRTFTLIQELDQQAQGHITNLTPAIVKYVSLRHALAAKILGNVVNANAATEGSSDTPAAEEQSTSVSTHPPGPNTNGNATNGHPHSPSPAATPAPASRKSKSRTPPAMKSLATVAQSSESTRELLISIAQFAEEVSRASNEKYYLARHVYDLVDRYIRDLDRAIKEQETSISLGLRPGTHPASIILPELIIPKSSRSRLVASPPPQESPQEMVVAVTEPVAVPPQAPGEQPPPPPVAVEDEQLDPPRVLEVEGEGELVEEEVVDVEEPIEMAQPVPAPSRGRRRGRRRVRRSVRLLPEPLPEPAPAEAQAVNVDVEEQSVDIEAEDDLPAETQPPLTLRIPAQTAAAGVPEGDAALDPNEPRYCFCNQVSYGRMIACDNDNCAIEWFHMGCVGITKEPKGEWYCRECASNNKRPKGKKRVR